MEPTLETIKEVDNEEVKKELIKNATDGTAEDQYKLGKYYYDLAKNEQEVEANGGLAVEWLVKGSLQGNHDATKLLKECILEKIGVTDDNVGEVNWCISTSDLDKSIRLAAKDLYEKLKPKDSSTLTKEVYFQKVKEIAEGKEEKKFLDSTGKKLSSDKDNDVVSEEDFVNIVARRMRSGQIDPLEDPVEQVAFKEAGLVRKMTKYPGATVTVAADGLVEFLTTDAVNVLMYLLPINELNVLIFLFLLSLLSGIWIFKVATLGVLFLSFFIMVICTLQMFQNNQKLKEVKAIAKILSKFNSGVKSDDAEVTFVRNSMKPYWTFFSALMAFVPAFFIAKKTYVPCSEFAIVSWIASLLCFVFLSNKRDPLIIFSLIVDILSSLPHLLLGFPEIPVLYQIVKLLTGNVFSIELGPGFFVNFGIPSLLYIIVPILFIRMAMKNSWSGMYTVLVPHLVAFFWWQLGVTFYEESTWLGLARGFLGYAGFILLFPVVSVGALIGGGYYAVTHFKVQTLIKCVSTSLLLIVPLGLTLWHESGYSLGSLSLRGKSFKTKMLAIVIPLVLVATAIVLGGGGGGSGDGGAVIDNKSLEWDLYKEYCSAPAWEERNMAAVQITCNHFKNMEAHWTGTVKHVQISAVENPAESFFNQLPPEFAEWLKCLYGKPYPKCNEKKMTPSDLKVCKLRQANGRMCHMNWDSSYTFKATIAMETDAGFQDVYLKGSHSFKKVMRGLRVGDVVNFKAILKDGLGTNLLELDLVQLECVVCANEKKQKHKHGPSTIDDVGVGLKKTISFFTSPILEFNEVSEFDVEKPGAEPLTSDETT